jgi:hypothetical protein
MRVAVGVGAVVGTAVAVGAGVDPAAAHADKRRRAPPRVQPRPTRRERKNIRYRLFMQNEFLSHQGLLHW